MKKNVYVSALLTMACGMMATGCGLLDRDDEEIVGNDWRTTGSYVYATFDHEGSVDALVGVGEDKLTVFYDAEEKEVYKRVSFPYETTDVQATAESLGFYDINGDGYTDIYVELYDQQGECSVVQYTWNADESEFEIYYDNGGYDIGGYDDNGEGDFSFINFIGAWVNADHTVELIIDSASNWQQGGNEEMVIYGTSTIDYGMLVLHTCYGDHYANLTFDSSNGTIFDEWGNVYTYDGPVEEHLNGDSFVYSSSSSYGAETGLVDGCLESGYYFCEDDDSIIYIDGCNYELYGYVEGTSERVVLDRGYTLALDDAGNFRAYSTDYYDEDGCEVFQFDTYIIIWNGMTYSMEQCAWIQIFREAEWRVVCVNEIG